jgi:hypothetical protein
MPGWPGWRTGRGIKGFASWQFNVTIVTFLRSLAHSPRVICHHQNSLPRCDAAAGRLQPCLRHEVAFAFVRVPPPY